MTDREAWQQDVVARVRKLQKALQEQEIEGALLVQSADIFYYTGTFQNGHLYLPVEGEPIYLVRRSVERARATTLCGRVVKLQSFRQIPALLQEHGFKLPRTLGLELDILPVSYFLQYQKLFPHTQFRDVSPIIRRQRAVKSAYELELLRESGRRLDQMLAAVPGLVELGETEVALAGRLEGEARRLGHQGLVRFRGFNPDFFMGHFLTGPSAAEPSYFDGPVSGPGLDPSFAFGPSWRRLAENEPIYVDYAFAWRGYVTDATRVYVVGRLKPELERAHQVALEIQQALLEEIRPGKSPASLYELACRMSEKAGLKEYFQGWQQPVRFIGHGVGLELNDLPVLAPGVEEPLEAGMVIAIEPKFVFPGEGAVGIENTVVVTPSGARRLTNYPDAVQILSGRN
ncbi:M24 family metallopeptidase [Ammonifex thiophilus]|uniref:Aminopeptidase P family protein n=1 Tax=Ammonifex thiophilus TaxID=444093 RepID=A0A3D8P5V5_9THEO|nr:Xaa-Pro peptidase family protein [Ammonifex thiophilus]RDV84710.1 aminopeptidase P family protein [Ammonifex thiophilus]